ncbi:MAG: hypothetical protein MJZ33_05935 [Paludibacteraceae bacterium]|nr:hypothetical protein [Paludibacteraceae bacterium]
MHFDNHIVSVGESAFALSGRMSVDALDPKASLRLPLGYEPLSCPFRAKMSIALGCSTAQKANKPQVQGLPLCYEPFDCSFRAKMLIV